MEAREEGVNICECDAAGQVRHIHHREPSTLAGWCCITNYHVVDIQARHARAGFAVKGM